MNQPAFAVQAVLFDLDGTLVDSAPDLALAAERMRAARQRPPLPLASYRPHASSGARGMIHVAFGVSPADPSYEALKREFLTHYEQCLLHHTRCFEGVDELVTTLTRRQMPWGIVTNKAQRLTEPVLAGLPTLAGAGTVVCGDTTPWPKPHPEPLREAARRLGVCPQACIYVGDDERDIVAGREAGMFTVAARYGYLGVGGETMHWGADAEVLSPLQVLKLLQLP
jgi:N-acetyl-D-muramate 6-phosphate phosphatase